MSADSNADKNIEKISKPDKTESRLDNPDAQEAREADKKTISEIGEQNPDNWMSAEGQFAIVDESQVLASRDVTVEKAAQAEVDFDKQNLSEELQAIKVSGNPDQSQLAEHIQEMRSAAKEKGLGTTEIDKFAQETFSSEGQEDQFKRGAFKPLQPKDQPVGGYEQENRADGGITLKVGVAEEGRSEKAIDGKNKITDSDSVGPNRLKAVEDATTYLKSEISRLHGRVDLDSLNIEESDVGYALGAYLLTPEISKAFGPEATRRFGQQLMVFGLAPSFGLANEVKQKFTQETGQTIHDGSSNFLWGSAFGAILESHPYVAASIGTIFMGALINEQLFSPEAKERNQQVVELAHQTGNSSPEDLIKQCDKSEKLLGPEAYKAAFEFATGGVGVPHGYTAAKGMKADTKKLDIAKIAKSTVDRLKQLPDDAMSFINKITSNEQKLLPADGPSLHKHNIPEAIPKDENTLFMTAADDFSGKGSSRWKSHFEDDFSKNVPHQIDKATGRLQRTDLGEIRQPYEWPVVNERFAPDVVRQSDGDSCVAKVGEILSDGLLTEIEIIEALKVSQKKAIQSLIPFLKGNWTQVKGPTSLAAVGENGPWGAVLNERAWNKYAKPLHSVIVEGRAADRNHIAILDPYEGTRYDMKIEDFLEAWTGLCIYRKSNK